MLFEMKKGDLNYDFSKQSPQIEKSKASNMINIKTQATELNLGTFRYPQASKTSVQPDPGKYADRKYNFQIENEEDFPIEVELGPVKCCCEGEYPAGFCLQSLL